MKILIIKPSSLGDVIHALRVISVIRKEIPEAQLHWVIKKGLEGIIESSGLIDDYFLFHRGGGILKFLKLGLSLRKQNYDLVFDMQGLFRSAVLNKFANAKKSFGCADGRELSTLFYECVGDPCRRNEKHAIEKLLPFLDCVGLTANNALHLKFYSLKKQNAGYDFLKNNNKNILIFPESRRIEKNWPHFEKLGLELNKRKGINVVIGGVNSNDRFKDFYDFRGLIRLGELPDFIGQSDIVITNDSAPLHIASALNIPLIAIFGPTRHENYGPYPRKGSKSIAIQSKNGSIEDIKVNQVLEAVESLLNT